ncbi:hypothetical protein [Actinomadura miaoliensis]|uniref:Uncharacterized protein n=1 Tax=Actinomadura miaoliensis TaxID=430685 RepID=A0ABP7X216_9ACTN
MYGSVCVAPFGLGEGVLEHEGVGQPSGIVGGLVGGLLPGGSLRVCGRTC